MSWRLAILGASALLACAPRSIELAPIGGSVRTEVPACGYQSAATALAYMVAPATGDGAYGGAGTHSCGDGCRCRCAPRDGERPAGGCPGAQPLEEDPAPPVSGGPAPGSEDPPVAGDPPAPVPDDPPAPAPGGPPPVEEPPAAAPVRVRIDVLPGSDENPVNLREAGTLPVAIMGDPGFDATRVDASAVRFAGAPVATTPDGRLIGYPEDVDGDGVLDLVLHFDVQALSLDSGATEAALEGRTCAGEELAGSDVVRIVP